MEQPPLSQLEQWMDSALDLARLAADRKEVPVGALVVRLDGSDEIVGRGWDRRVELQDPTAHAEILALREAGQNTGDWRLENCALIVTLEPCLMCAGATLLARVPLLVIGADNPKFGAAGGRMDSLSGHGWNHSVEIIRGIRKEPCAAILRDFFRSLRSD
jgi:tRNA(adenine34) deaminase